MSGDRQNRDKPDGAGVSPAPVLTRSPHHNTPPTSIGQRLTAVAVVLSLSLLPWFLAADDQPSAQREANQKHFNDMTVTERQRLRENYELYREMTPGERDRLRELHRAIENDPDLKAAFRDYEAWANALSPVDRHELRQARDPETRRQLIERIRRRPPPPDMPGPPGSDRPNGPQSFGPNFVGRGPRPQMLERLFGRSVPLGGDRLASFVPEMEAMVQVLEKELPPDKQSELSQLDSLSRKVRVVRLTLERHPVGPPAIRIFGPPSSGTSDKMLDALPDGQVKQFATNRNPAPLAQRNMLLLALIRGLMTEMQRSIEDHRPPGPEMLRSYQEKLPESERRRLDGLNREDHQLELQQLYLKEKMPGIVELQKLVGLPEMERYFQEMIGQMRGGPNPPDGDERRGPKGRQPPPEGPGRPKD